MEPREPPAAPDAEAEQEFLNLLARINTLIELSRQERERVEKLHDQLDQGDHHRPGR